MSIEKNLEELLIFAATRDNDQGHLWAVSQKLYQLYGGNDAAEKLIKIREKCGLQSDKDKGKKLSNYASLCRARAKFEFATLGETYSSALKEVKWQNSKLTGGADFTEKSKPTDIKDLDKIALKLSNQLSDIRTDSLKLLLLSINIELNKR